MKKYLQLNNEIANTYHTTGVLDLEKEKETTKSFFLDEVNVKMRYFIDLEEKLKYLVNEGYYEKEFLDMYSFSFIKSIFKLAYSYNFRFESFMAASKFYNSYAMKSKDGQEILEKYEDRVAIMSLYLAQGDEKLATNAVKAIMEAYQPATPTTNNSGKKARGELVSCFKLLVDDSMNSIADTIGSVLELSRLGGGVGLCLTDLRPLGDPIKEIENRASGVMPVCKIYENSFSYSNQLGQRQGSGVVYLNIFHADIEEFISAKKPNADEKIRLATLSTGVVIPSIFFELMKKDKDIVLFSPYDIKKAYGKRMSEIEISDMYYDLLDNPKIRKIKKVNARKLYSEIKKSQFESGYPFEMYEDNANDMHPLKNIGRIKMSNLCTEILQVQETSLITDKDKPNELGLDVSCNLGSIDIHKASKYDNFEELIDTANRLLVSVSDLTYIQNVESVAKANQLMHSVGLGAMNLHGHLAANDIEYGSKESIYFVDYLMEAMNYFSLLSSSKIAKERGETFYKFEDSDYASGIYFDQYVNKSDEVYMTPKIVKALGNIPIISSAMWKELKDHVQKHGVFSAYRLAVAPTGSISYVRNSTASLSPITERVETRDYGDSRTIYPMPFLTNENAHLYTEAYDMDMYKMIDLYSAAQKHVDQGISMTLYITDQWTTEELARLYGYAHHKGLKSVYYVRQRMQTLDECVSCSI